MAYGSECVGGLTISTASLGGGSARRWPGRLWLSHRSVLAVAGSSSAQYQTATMPTSRSDVCEMLMRRSGGNCVAKSAAT
jgi:hypothetical protein